MSAPCQGLTMTGDSEGVREVLLRHSDSRACRALWAAHDGGDALDARDCAEALQATGGELCLVVADGPEECYARWDPARGFEQLTVWPPWSVVDYDGGMDRADAVSLLDGGEPKPLPTDASPFAHGDVLSGLPGLVWP